MSTKTAQARSTNRPRYYWQRKRVTGGFKVHDRELDDETVATCNYREQAELVTAALNEYRSPAPVNVDLNVKDPNYDYHSLTLNRPA